MQYKIQSRRQRTLARWEAILALPNTVPEVKQRIQKEVNILHDRINNIKRPKKAKADGTQPAGDRYFIDIFQINLAYVKNSERRKNKGKSKKKLKKQRSTVFVKSVVSQPGMMQRYRDGLMGVSPKNHSFRFRKDEPTFY